MHRHRHCHHHYNIRDVSLLLFTLFLLTFQQQQQHASVSAAVTVSAENDISQEEEEIITRMTTNIRGSSTSNNNNRRRKIQQQDQDQGQDQDILEFLNNTVDISNNNFTSGGEYTQDIRGGFDILPNETIPWYAVFQDTTLCGGALVHGDIVLTAAHCVYKKFPKQLRIGSIKKDSGGTLVNVNFGRIHPDYTGNIRDKGADVAVMRIDRFLSNEVAYVNPEPLVPKPGDRLFVAGFGKLGRRRSRRLAEEEEAYYHHPKPYHPKPYPPYYKPYHPYGYKPKPLLPSTLQGLFLDYIPNCKKRYYQYNPTFQICGDASPYQGTCAGDSGSPVVLAGTNNLVGINSFSDGDCSYQSIDVYTRVSEYSLWIYQQICALTAVQGTDGDALPAFCSEIDVGCGLFLNAFNAFNNFASRYFVP